MNEEQVPYEKLGKSKKSKEMTKRKPKKPHVISNEDAQILMAIAEKAKKLRKNTNLSYEEFALKAGINRNSYFRFEQSAVKPNNYTISLLLEVLRGLDMTPSDFFTGIK